MLCSLLQGTLLHSKSFGKETLKHIVILTLSLLVAFSSYKTKLTEVSCCFFYSLAWVYMLRLFMG